MSVLGLILEPQSKKTARGDLSVALIVTVGSLYRRAAAKRWCSSLIFHGSENDAWHVWKGMRRACDARGQRRVFSGASCLLCF